MFETSETDEVLEKTLWQKYVLFFAAGCFITGLMFAVYVVPAAKRAAAHSAEQAAQRKFSAELSQNPLDAQLASAKAALQAASQERDLCKSRFVRQTILYDNTIPIDPGKVWIIPADVEPIATGDHHVTYTHYDPKTKQESAHFYLKKQ